MHRYTTEVSHTYASLAASVAVMAGATASVEVATTGLMAGNSRTSLMLAESVKNMTNRSIPNPQPPVGGRPYSRAFKKVSSTP